MLFGSGYVVLAFLRADLVDRWHWLMETIRTEVLSLRGVVLLVAFRVNSLWLVIGGGLAGAVIHALTQIQ